MTTQKNQTQCLIFTDRSIKENPEICKKVIAWYEANYTSVKVPQLLELGLGEKAVQKEYWRLIEEQIAIYNEFVAKNPCFGNMIFFSFEELASADGMVKANSKFYTESGNECEVFIWDDMYGCPIWPNGYQEEKAETGGEAKITEEPSWIDELAEKIAEKVLARLLNQKDTNTNEVIGVLNNTQPQRTMLELFHNTQSQRTMLELFPEIQEDKMVTAKEASEILKSSENTIFVYAKKGAYSYYKTKSGRYTFNLKEMIHFFKNNPLRNFSRKGRF